MNFRQIYFGPLLLLMTLTAHSQQSTPTATKPLKVNSRIVAVDVVVTDKNGAPVRGLKREDFRVLEDGKPQEIRSFDAETGGGLVVPVPQTAAGTATNVGQESSTPALHVILFDALNTAPSDLSFARSQLKKLLANFSAGTRVAFFVLRNQLHLVQGFTTDTQQLMTAVDKQTGVTGPWFNDPEMVFLSGAAGNAGSSLAETMTGSGAAGLGSQSTLGQDAARTEAGLSQTLRIEKTLDALNGIANYLHALPGRKNVIWMAGTFPINLLPDVQTAQGTADGGNPFTDTTNFTAALERMALTMELSDVAIYPVQVTGLETSPLFGGANGKLPSSADIAAVTGARMQQHQVMDDIAHQTGGRAVYDDNDLKGAVTEIINQGSDYYTLTYSPLNHDWNGKARKIRVELNDRADRLDYRHEYLAVDPNAIEQSAPSPTPMTVAMQRGAPEQGGIPFALTAKPTGDFVLEADRKPPELLLPGQPPLPKIKGTTEKYTVATVIDAKALKFTTAADGRYVPQLAITMAAYDADGKMLNATVAAFALPLLPQQYQAVLAKGLTLSNTFELPAGRVFLRVGVHDLNGQRIGSVEMPVDVKLPAQTKLVAQKH